MICQGKGKKIKKSNRLQNIYNINMFLQFHTAINHMNQNNSKKVSYKKEIVDTILQ